MQPELDFTGEQNRDRGIKQAIDNANYNYENWSEDAYNFLLEFIKGKLSFMAEDLVSASVGIIPNPPSRRAFGAIVVRAKKEGKIIGLGFEKKKGKNANCTPSMLWSVVSGAELCDNCGVEKRVCICVQAVAT